MLKPRFPSLERAAVGLITNAPQPEPETVPVTWEDILETWNRLLDDWVLGPALPRAARMQCGPGVADWLKESLPTIKDSSSPFGVPHFAGITIHEDAELAPGAYKIIDQYGNTMREGVCSR